MRDILENPLVKAWLNKHFNKHMEKEGIKGVYLTLVNGNITVVDVPIEPFELTVLKNMQQ